MPISFGFPFGLSLVIPPNIPLPAKIVMRAAPVDIVAEFGEDPDIDEVDAHVRHVMQRALDELADAPADPRLRVDHGAVDRLNDTLGMVATMRRAGLIAPLRPDKYLRIAAAMRRENVSFGFRLRRAAVPGPAWPRRRARHPDLARNRPAVRRVRRGAAGAAPAGSRR